MLLKELLYTPFYAFLFGVFISISLMALHLYKTRKDYRKKWFKLGVKTERILGNNPHKDLLLLNIKQIKKNDYQIFGRGDNNLL